MPHAYALACFIADDPMPGALTVIVIFQLAGELLAKSLALPVPGPVLGMALLFASLVWHGRVPPSLTGLADGFTRHLSLLFVPAGVGLMVHASLLEKDWLAISAAIFGSTVLALIATAVVARLVQVRLRKSSS